MFVPQSTLEAWLDAGTADMDARGIRLPTTGLAYAIEPAVRFVATIPEGHASRLLGRIVTERKVVEAGGELMGDSVLFGDVGYTVQAGYVATRV